MEIKEYYKNEYLTCGKTYDNYIFTNCPIEFLKSAYQSLSQQTNEVKPINIKIDRRMEIKLEKLFGQCLSDFHKMIFARDFFNTLFMIQLLQGSADGSGVFSLYKKGKSVLLSGDYNKAKTYNVNAPIYLDIEREIKKHGKIELNIFLVGTENIYLQQAINNYISARTPYSIKVFTSCQYLPCYADQNGNLIECPHDYISQNPKDFICVDDANLDL